MRALPVTPHDWYGSWNYTIDPATHNTDRQANAGAQDPTLARSPTLTLLSNPIVTGMTGQELDELVTQLAPARAAQTAQRCYARRGGRRRNAPAAGARPLLTDADRVMLTLVYLRQHCSQKVLTELLEINPHSIGDGNRGHPPATRRTPTHHLAHHHAVHHRGRPVAVFDNRRIAHHTTTRARPII